MYTNKYNAVVIFWYFVSVLSLLGL